MSESKQDKIYVSPEIYMYPNDEHSTYQIRITLQGVNKENIKLKMHEDSFFIKAESDDTIYIGSYSVCCPIDPHKAKADYKNGLLKVEVPFMEPEFHSVDIKVE
jgi:HSP20 family protein